MHCVTPANTGGFILDFSGSKTKFINFLANEFQIAT